MHPVILICSSPFERAEPLIKALQNIGIEARETTFQEIKGERLEIPEATVVAIKTPESYVLSLAAGNRRDQTLRRAAAIALVSSASIANGSHMRIPEIPEQPKIEPQRALSADKLLDDDFLFEKTKPDWPKAQHIMPTANWTNRHHAFHPARSRDKARMR